MAFFSLVFDITRIEPSGSDRGGKQTVKGIFVDAFIPVNAWKSLWDFLALSTIDLEEKHCQQWADTEIDTTG